MIMFNAVALLTARIKYMAEHMKTHKKVKSSLSISLPYSLWIMLM